MSRPSLDLLENKDEFVNRHIGPSDKDIAEMLAVVFGIFNAHFRAPAAS